MAKNDRIRGIVTEAKSDLKKSEGGEIGLMVVKFICKASNDNMNAVHNMRGQSVMLIVEQEGLWDEQTQDARG
jgi:hypothetical protein